MDFGIRDLDGSVVVQMVEAVTSFEKRNYISMQVKNNLVAEERKRMLGRFDPMDYKRIALVVMGEPPANFKAKAHNLLLDEKKKKAVEAVKRAREAADDKKK